MTAVGESRPSGRMRAVQTIVLIVADVGFRSALADALVAAGFRAVVADGADAGIDVATASRASLIVIDVAIGSHAGTDGTSVIRRIRLDTALRDVPCVLLTAPGEVGGELRALDAGADAFDRRDEVLDVIVTRISGVLARLVQPDDGERAPPRILAVDDDTGYLDPLVGLLRGAGYLVTAAGSGEDALEWLANEEFDCILLDLNMPGIGGLETCRRIKTAPMVRDVPTIMLTAIDDRDATIEVLTAGADDLILKSSSISVVKARLRAHIRRKQIEDDNRRMREALLAAEIEAAEARAGRELADAQAVMVEELGRKNNELEAFAYSVSHDLRAPLRAILGFCRALVEDNGPQLDVQGREHLERVVTNAKRMNELIGDMLELSRIGRVDLRRSEVDLSAIAREVAAELRRREPTRAVEILVENGLTLDADGKLIRIVLENLIGNAWKFTGKVAQARIEVARATTPHGTAMSVRDNGAGFDPKGADKLFQPFRRLHAERDYEGTGIGLATVHRIIDRHGGRVWADAAPGEGATFFFTVGRARGGTMVIPKLA